MGIALYRYTFLITFPACQSQLVGPDPPNQAVLKGNTHTVTCSKSSDVPNQLTWIDDIDSIKVQMFLGTNKISFDAKYDNFEVVADTPEDLNLNINTADVSDEGDYVCQLAGTGIQQGVTLVVESR